jgi:hypothetical protein
MNPLSLSFPLTFHSCESPTCHSCPSHLVIPAKAGISFPFNTILLPIPPSHLVIPATLFLSFLPLPPCHFCDSFFVIPAKAGISFHFNPTSPPHSSPLPRHSCESRNLLSPSNPHSPHKA